MKDRDKVIISFIILVGLIFSLYIFTDWFSKVTGYFSGEDERERLVKCLDKQDTEFYSSVRCPDCEKQVEIIGKSFSGIKEVSCGQTGELCPNIREQPAWYINQEIYYGLKSIDELKEISGCY